MAENESINFGMKIPKLEGVTNWPEYKKNVKLLLTVNKVLSVIDGTWVKPVVSENPEEKKAYEKWLSNDAVAQLIFTTSVMPNVSQLIIPCASAKEMWEKLISIYEQSSGQRLDILYNSFFNFKTDPTDDIAKHISKLECLWYEMQDELFKQEKLKLLDSMLMCRIINTLPDEYFDFKSVWESVPKEDRSVDNLTQRLRLLEVRIQQRDVNELSSSTAFIAKTHANKSQGKGTTKDLRKYENKSKEGLLKSKEIRECYFCHRKGHLAKSCWYAKQKEQKFKGKIDKPTQNENLNAKNESLISESLDVDNENTWIGDTGATNHITNNADFYTSYEHFNTLQTVKVGSNERLTAYGKGTIEVNTCVNGKWQKHSLIDVWYVPDFNRNVMSLQCTLDKGFEMKMSSKICKLYKKTSGEVIVEGIRLPGGLYGMRMKSIKPEEAAEVNIAKTENVDVLQLWHERFGHQNKKHVQKWLKEQGIETKFNNELCEACIYGKQHRLSFGSRENYRSIQPGNLIHADLCGPMQEMSKGGMRYFLCFKDDFSKYRCIYFLKEKSEVVNKLEQFLLEAKTRGHVIKELLTDGGKEFVNKKVLDVTTKYGIHHRVTMPYTPQQNGSSERENRTIVEAARSMIYAKDLPLNFWAEAVNTAVYILNRTGPTAFEGKSPFELWFNRKPAINHLRIFGTECFVHIPDVKRRKLNAKSRKGILVGYCGDKDGYRIWMHDSNEITVSRDVIFKEDLPTFSFNIKQREDTDSENKSTEDLNCTSDENSQSNNEEKEDTKYDETRKHYNLRDRSTLLKPTRYRYAEVNVAEVLEPQSYKEAMQFADAHLWKQAMEDEMNSLKINNVFELSALPPGHKAINCKWILKRKMKPDGNIDKYKARLVACGFSQKKDIDYDETYSPVVRFDTIRTLLATIASENLKTAQFDIKTAFLYGELEDEIYVNQPEGYQNGTNEVWKLKKSLYGLKQAPRCWNKRLVEFMKQQEFQESSADPCLFFRRTNNGQKLIVSIYVDDGIIAGTSELEVKKFLDDLISNMYHLKNR